MFVDKIVARFNIGPDETLVAVVGFGNRATTFIKLDDYTEVNGLINGINTRMRYKVDCTISNLTCIRYHNKK